MKIHCRRTTQLPGAGIVRAGETVEVEDGYASNPLVQVNFDVVEGPTAGDAAPVTDDSLRAKCVAGILKLGIRNVKEALTDAGIHYPQRASDERIAEIYYDNFGFDTEPVEAEASPYGAERPKPEKAEDPKPEKAKPAKGR